MGAWRGGFGDLKFLTWSSTPVRLMEWVRAWLNIRAWVEDPQFTSTAKHHSIITAEHSRKKLICSRIQEKPVHIYSRKLEQPIETISRNHIQRWCEVVRVCVSVPGFL